MSLLGRAVKHMGLGGAGIGAGAFVAAPEAMGSESDYAPANAVVGGLLGGLKGKVIQKLAHNHLRKLLMAEARRSGAFPVEDRITYLNALLKESLDFGDKRTAHDLMDESLRAMRTPEYYDSFRPRGK